MDKLVTPLLLFSTLEDVAWDELDSVVWVTVVVV